MTMLAKLLEADRRREGLSIGQVAYRVGLTPAEYQALLEDTAG